MNSSELGKAETARVVDILKRILELVGGHEGLP